MNQQLRKIWIPSHQRMDGCWRSYVQQPLDAKPSSLLLIVPSERSASMVLVLIYATDQAWGFKERQRDAHGLDVLKASGFAPKVCDWEPLIGMLLARYTFDSFSLFRLDSIWFISPNTRSFVMK